EATPVAGVESECAEAAPGLERDAGITAVAAVTEANWTVGLQLSEQRARVVQAQFAATAEDLHTVHRQQPVATPQAGLRGGTIGRHACDAHPGLVIRGKQHADQRTCAGLFDALAHDRIDTATLAAEFGNAFGGAAQFLARLC